MTDDYYDESAAALAIIGIVYAVIIGLTLLFAVGYYVLMSLALSKFFRKVGVEPWIGWVPFYNNWKWLEVGGQPGWLALLPLAGASIVTSVFLYIGMHRTGKAFRKDTGFLVLGIFLPFVWLFMLGGRDTVYQPELITQAGYPPPLAGHGAVSKPVQDQWKAYFTAMRTHQAQQAAYEQQQAQYAQQQAAYQQQQQYPQTQQQYPQQQPPAQPGPPPPTV